jgi:amino acid transporter
MYNPALLRDRSRPTQIVVAGVIPAVIGALAGILIGASSIAYYALGFPPLLAVLTAIVGMFLSAAGGRIARVQRERAGLVLPAAQETVR